MSVISQKIHQVILTRKDGWYANIPDPSSHGIVTIAKNNLQKTNYSKVIIKCHTRLIAFSTFVNVVTLAIWLSRLVAI